MPASVRVLSSATTTGISEAREAGGAGKTCSSQAHERLVVRSGAVRRDPAEEMSSAARCCCAATSVAVSATLLVAKQRRRRVRGDAVLRRGAARTRSGDLGPGCGAEDTAQDGDHGEYGDGDEATVRCSPGTPRTVARARTARSRGGPCVGTGVGSAHALLRKRGWARWVLGVASPGAARLVVSRSWRPSRWRTSLSAIRVSIRDADAAYLLKETGRAPSFLSSWSAAPGVRVPFVSTTRWPGSSSTACCSRVARTPQVDGHAGAAARGRPTLRACRSPRRLVRVSARGAGRGRAAGR